MVTQSASKSQSSILENIMRNYQVVLKCTSQSQREEINNRIRRLEEKQTTLLTRKIVEAGIELYRTKPQERFFERQLCKSVGKSPNIAQSTFHWLKIAIKGKIDKEKKFRVCLNF